MTKKLALITVVIYLIAADIVFMITPLFASKPVRASVYPRTVISNSPIVFKDSTEGAETVRWEFGNGAVTNKAKGLYTFVKPGHYPVRVTVNGEQQQTFMIEVTAPPVVAAVDSTVSIYAEKTGVAGQKVHFKAMGKGIEWSEWHFTQGSTIDARTAETFHAYERAGTYEVSLLTNLNPMHPKIHKIVIQKPYTITESVVLKKSAKKEAAAAPVKAEEPDVFKSKLQAIANGESFSSTYTFLVKNYLCSNPKTPIVVNGKTGSDFYSYCQSLQMNSGIIIKNAVVEINPSTHCAIKVVIQQ